MRFAVATANWLSRFFGKYIYKNVFDETISFYKNCWIAAIVISFCILNESNVWNWANSRCTRACAAVLRVWILNIAYMRIDCYFAILLFSFAAMIASGLIINGRWKKWENKSRCGWNHRWQASIKNYHHHHYHQHCLRVSSRRSEACLLVFSLSLSAFPLLSRRVPLYGDSR